MRPAPSDARSGPSTIALPDGRRLAWSEYGESTGTPVVHCHGGMSSRLDARRLDDLARVVGARLICPDRPGIGRSGRAPGRRLRDWPADVAVLADHLSIETFAVTGWSAGGPYAVACAARLAGRVTALALVASATPYAAMENRLHPVDRLLFWSAGKPSFVSRVLGEPVRIVAAASPRAARLVSLAVLDRPSRVVVRSMDVADFGEPLAEGFRHPAGVGDDFRALREDWGVDLASVECPVLLGQGQEDGFIAVELVRWLGARLRSPRIESWAGEGHFLSEAAYRTVLDFLVSARTPRPG